MAISINTETAVAGLNTTEDIVADLRAGRMVIIMDDEARENEGDLIMAASRVRASDVNFMARAQGIRRNCRKRNRSAARHQLHLVHRSRQRDHDGDFGP